MTTNTGKSRLRLIPAVSAASLVAFFAWASWAELDQVSRATGQVIPAGRVQIVQSAEGGVIDEIRVREGDTVKRGELMVRLDTVKIAAAVEEGEAKVASLKGTLARIEAELFDRPLVFPADVQKYPEVIGNQRLLYAKRRAALQSQIHTLEEVKELMRQEMAMNRPLIATGDVSRTEILRIERSLADVGGQIANRRAQYVQDLQAEYTKVSDDLVTAEQTLAQRRDSLAYSRLVAPTAGIVKNIRLTTVGGVLRPGDEVLQIVPTDEELIVEARVAPSDIAFVKVGQSAGVKFDAYDSAIYGSANGRVTYVSADTLTEQTPEGQSTSYYRVHVKVDTRSMRAGAKGKIEIQPGMTAVTEIKTGQSTVLRYLTKPLLKTMSESLSER